MFAQEKIASNGSIPASSISDCQQVVRLAASETLSDNSKPSQRV
jgi:hypothetical protein